MLTPVTMARCSLGRTWRTWALLPLSFPRITITWSSFFILFMALNHLRGKRDDLHEVALAQFAGNRAKDPSPTRILLVAENDGGVIVEPDIGSIRPPILFRRANDDRAHHLTLFDRRIRLRDLHRGNDRVANPRVAAAGSTGHENAHDFPRAGV